MLIFQPRFIQIFSNVFKFNWPHLRVSIPMFRPGPSTKDFNKIDENYDISVEVVKYTSDNIFWWHCDYGILSGGNDTSKRHFDTTSTRFGFLNQCKQISTTAMSDFTVPRCGTSHMTGKTRLSQCQTLLGKPLISIISRIDLISIDFSFLFD